MKYPAHLELQLRSIYLEHLDDVSRWINRAFLTSLRKSPDIPRSSGHSVRTDSIDDILREIFGSAGFQRFEQIGFMTEIPFPFLLETSPATCSDAWFHFYVCEKLTHFVEGIERGESPRLMIFIPPRHGKGHIVSQRLPDGGMGGRGP